MDCGMTRSRTAETERHNYFEKEGAYFRRYSSTPMSPIDDVWTGTEWIKYQGNRGAVVDFEDRVSGAELPISTR
jgi:hypothetical protein